MFIRIVKMSFNHSAIDTFIENFNNSKKEIRNIEGCRLLELYRDRNNATTFFTYSYWDTEANLEAYRNSDLFKTVWGKTKSLFNEKPQAWSVDKLDSL